MKLTVDFSKALGKIKAMHAVGQPPFLGMTFDNFKYLSAAHIPYSRLHDVGGAYGKGVFVDIPNLFRDFDADENDPGSYDFAFTDALLGALMEYGVKPFFVRHKVTAISGAIYIVLLKSKIVMCNRNSACCISRNNS